jgi:formylglycine-generating enzyme required for sulfatase activity
VVATSSLLVAGCAARERTASLAGAWPAIELVLISAGPGAARPFHIGKYEITNAQYQAFIDATGYDGADHPSSKPTEQFLDYWVDGKHPAELRDYPVCRLNWHHAQAFCDWLSRKSGRVVRLPTDAEWEWAARGVEGRAYPWGDRWDPQRCNWGDGGKIDGYRESAPVGSFPAGATPEGVCDLAGNIWEWTAEKHQRGGPWCLDGRDSVRSARIDREDPDRADDKFGFRIVVETP